MSRVSHIIFACSIIAAFVLTWSSNGSQALAQQVVVQVMSVNNPESAASEVSKLLEQGAPSFQRAEDVPGAGLRYRVYLGPFDSREEAVGAAEALKGSGVVSEYLVRTEAEVAAASTVPTTAAAPPATAGDYWPPPQGQTQTTTPQAAPPASTGDYWPPPPGQTQTTTPPSNSGDYWPPPPGQTQTTAPPAANGDYWPPPPGQTQTTTPPATTGDYWPPPPGQTQATTQTTTPPPAQQAAPPAATGDYWPPPPGQTQTTTPQAATPAAQQAAPPATTGDYWPAPPGQPAATPSQSPPSVDPASAGVSPSTPVLQPQSTPAALAPPVVAAAPPTTTPAASTGSMKVQGFVVLSDLSSSMRKLSTCPGGLVKQEAVNSLLRKMNHRIPNQPYTAALRVFGYKQAWSRKDYTTLYYGPAAYTRAGFENSIGRLFAADSISPFGWALSDSEKDLAAMNNPRVILMFADFEETTDSGKPVDKAKSIVRNFGNDTRIYTYYVTMTTEAKNLAKNIAGAANGKAYNICDLLGNEAAFEGMMTEIFGPMDLPPCKDIDKDGVCDEQDVCPATPVGAPVDERGCWIAAYSQFFDFDKAEVKYAFEPRIKYAAELIVKNPQIGVVTIAGHTDGKGTEEYNMDLGRRRAEAVKTVLVKYGAPTERLVVESYGKTRPIAENDTEEGRAKNRRVEFHVGETANQR